MSHYKFVDIKLNISIIPKFKSNTLVLNLKNVVFFMAIFGNGVDKLKEYFLLPNLLQLFSSISFLF